MLLSTFLGSGGKILGPPLSRSFFTSGTFTAPQDGYMIVRGIGAGGGGAHGGISTGSAVGGGSGAWGARIFKVSAGATAVFTIGAGGTRTTAEGGSGGNGGATTIVVNGVTLTMPGGFGGTGSATALAIAGAAGGGAPVNCHMGAAGSRSGNTAAVNQSYTGGAGVDLFAQGGNATRSGDLTVAGNSAGGGVYSAGSSANFPAGGCGPNQRNAAGEASTSVVPFGNPPGWLIPFTGGGAIAANQPGGPGGGGTGNGAGGYGAGGGGNGGNGGIGGGGGAVSGSGTASGIGGDGYGSVEFYADMGLS